MSFAIIGRLFENFDICKISSFDHTDVQRLLKNPSIIRNKRKIEATIFNARRLIEIRKTHNGFANWIQTHHPLLKKDWIKVFRNNFKFTGPIIVEEFLQSISYLPGAHEKNCPIYQKIEELNPPWKSK